MIDLVDLTTAADLVKVMNDRVSESGDDAWLLRLSRHSHKIYRECLDWLKNEAAPRLRLHHSLDRGRLPDRAASCGRYAAAEAG